MNNRNPAKDFAERYNHAPLDDFHGLSPYQMHRFLYFPFDSEQIVSFPHELGQNPDAPILSLFKMLADAIGEKGLKPTATGNLPRKVCRQIALDYLGEDAYRDLTLWRNLNSETDYLELNVTRLVAGMAGLIRKYKGRFILGRQCRDLITKGSLDVIYTRLFRSYVEKYNWEYGDPYLRADLIQGACLFSLYLLIRYGDTPRPVVFYEDCFLQAFPKALDRMAPQPYFTPEQRFRSSYTHRTMIRFLEFFALVKARPLVGGKRKLGRDFEITKLPLLDRMVHFYLV